MKLQADEKEKLCIGLWNECKDELTRLCEYKLSSHPDEVEDIIADTFYYLCVAVFEERKIDNYRAWLTTVTNNLIKKKYTELKKMKLKNITYIDEDIDIHGYIDDMIIDSLISDSVIEGLCDAIICELTPVEQKLYHYIYVDKLKMKEIAVLLDITEANVRQRNHRLTKKLKTKIKKYLDEM